MNAFDKYGLDIMGISDIESANTALIKLTVSIFGEQSETAFRVLHGCLDELYTKADVLCTRCYGSFRIFTTLMGELTDKGIYYLRHCVLSSFHFYSFFMCNEW